MKNDRNSPKTDPQQDREKIGHERNPHNPFKQPAVESADEKESKQEEVESEQLRKETLTERD